MARFSSMWTTPLTTSPFTRGSRRTATSTLAATARNLGLRPAQSLAHDRGSEDRPSLGRAERPGPVGTSLSRQEGRELRVERLRGELSVLSEPQARSDAARQTDARAPAFGDALAHRR